MLELASALLSELAQGKRVAVAIVIRVDGSAPRALGTAMAVTEDGSVIGSISGGCVESAAYDTCQAVLSSGIPQVVEYGYSDTDAFAVGLSCGGQITVYVVEIGAGMASDSLLSTQLRLAAQNEPAGFGVLMMGGDAELLLPGTTSGSATIGRDNRLRQSALADLESRILEGATRLTRPAAHVPDAALLAVVQPLPPRMIIFGAVDFSAALSRNALLLGYRVTVCDARPVFATETRFPGAEVVIRWPSDYLRDTEIDHRTVVCILTHDDKFDLPLIETALRLPVAYVGAMGSRRTHNRRIAALATRNLSSYTLSLLHSPIGLDLGAVTPDETAIAILAEIIQSKSGATGRPLRSTSGAIHKEELHRAPATSRTFES